MEVNTFSIFIFSIAGFGLSISFLYGEDLEPNKTIVVTFLLPHFYYFSLLIARALMHAYFSVFQLSINTENPECTVSQQTERGILENIWIEE